MDLGSDFCDFGDLGLIWVVIFVIAMIWGRFGDDLGGDFGDFGDLGWIWVVIFVISVIWG